MCIPIVDSSTVGTCRLVKLPHSPINSCSKWVLVTYSSNSSFSWTYFESRAIILDNNWLMIGRLILIETISSSAVITLFAIVLIILFNSAANLSTINETLFLLK